jgi:HlyD family secretion protein
MPSQAVLPSSTHKPPVRTIAVVVIALLVAGGLALKFGRPKPAVVTTVIAPAAAPPEVRVEYVTDRVTSDPIRVTGTLRTDETVTLSTKATGIVRRVLAKEGDRVRRGQLLVEIDATDLRAQRDRAVAAVRAAQAQVGEAEAAVQAASAKLEQARTGRGMRDVAAGTDYRRAQQAVETSRTRLSQSKSLAGIAGTEAETRVSSARSSLQAARERLKALQEGSRKQELATAQSAVTRAQAQVNRMKSMLDRREQLFRDKAVAAEVVDNARRDYEVATSDLDAAQQQLSLAQEGPRTEEVRVAEEAVRQAENALRDAEANRERRKVSNEDVQAAEQQVQQSQAALEAAKANLAQRQWNADDVRNAQAAVAQARATVNRYHAAASQAQADVRYQDELIAQTKVFSPVNGVVTDRKVQTGAAVVQTRNELMTLVSSDTLYFEATAPESSLPRLQPGLPATVTLDAMPGRTFPGRVRQIIPVAEGTNRSVRLRISFPRPPQDRAVVGGFARAEIQGRSSGGMLSVPRAAIVSDEGQMSVFTLKDGKAARHAVTMGDPGGTGDRVPIISGLHAGEAVIVEGASSLSDGQPVTVQAGGGR